MGRFFQHTHSFAKCITQRLPPPRLSFPSFLPSPPLSPSPAAHLTHSLFFTYAYDRYVPFLIPFQTGSISKQSNCSNESVPEKPILPFSYQQPLRPRRLSVSIPTMPYPLLTTTRTIPFAYTPLSLVLRATPTRWTAASLRKSQVARSRRSSPCYIRSRGLSFLLIRLSVAHSVQSCRVVMYCPLGLSPPAGAYRALHSQGHCLTNSRKAGRCPRALPRRPEVQALSAYTPEPSPILPSLPPWRYYRSTDIISALYSSCTPPAARTK